MTALLDHVHTWLPLCRITDLVGICRWHSRLFAFSGFWKYSWAHLVIDYPFGNHANEWCSVFWGPEDHWHPTNVFNLVPYAQSLSSLSESFNDVMHCRWCNLQSLCNFTLRNVVFKVFYNLFMHTLTDWRASTHLHFWETLPFEDIPFNVTDLMLINLISC